MKTRVHFSINIEGMLRNHKRKKINYMLHEDGTPMTDREAREYLQQCLAKGWKLIPSTDACEGFDHFEKGCPGHPIIDPPTADPQQQTQQQQP